MATNRDKNPKRNNKNGAFPRFSITWFWAALALLIIASSLWMEPRNEAAKSNWNEVEQMVQRGDVEKIVVLNGELAKVTLKPEAVEKYRSQEVTSTFPRRGCSSTSISARATPSPRI